ncbi:hypothetical protein [Wolbachia endosymbiont (group A) of Andrena hattorfiana]|uniref:hypothetical protein n=1 Tax=Wolbachia endosymbiont (group A) of Andrena hattorfiana TaxID=2953977 RepID=UPI0021F88AF2|nr:hypothetical protein [Wolbachia endosymbiont (group A) of Andrena hattorfiana]
MTTWIQEKGGCYANSWHWFPSKKVVSWKCDIKRSKKKDNSIKMWLSPGLSNRKTVVL